MIRPFVVAAFCFFAFWAMVAELWGHAFYGSECCGGHDCAPLASERVQVRPEGYVVDGRHTVPHSKALLSPDTNFHGCFPKSMMGKLGCFYAPRGST